MKKKILSILIAFALVLTLLPVSALAAENTVSTWAELSAAVSAAPTNGTAVTIKMTDDITTEAVLRIEAGKKITLDLNGKTLNLNGFDIFASANVTFTIEDSVGGGTITGGSGECGGCISSVSGGLPTYIILKSGTIQNCTATTPTWGGGAIYLNKNAHFIMDGGTIQNCTAANIGGAVYINSQSSFTMNGGTITGCHTTAGGGGAVFLGATGAAFNLHGGTITGCSAVGIGGGVLVEKQGTFRMDGGTISECSSAHGGGVYVLAGGAFTMDDGTIYHCNAPSGGGVTVYGTFNLNGGVIDSCYTNTGYAQGGGMCVANGATFNMTGGTVKNNYAKADGGGAYFYMAASVSISGGEFYNNTGDPGGGIRERSAVIKSCTGGRFDVANSYVGILPTDTYTVTLNQNGGSDGTDSVAQAWNTDLTTVTVPTREDYDFLGYFNADGDQYYKADGSGVRKWDYIGNQTLYAHWTQHGVRELTSMTDDPGTENVDNSVAFDVFAVVDADGDGDYADITYYVSIAWSVDTSGIEFENGALYEWSTEKLKYVPVVGKTIQLLGDDTSVDMEITVTNRSNAAVSYGVSYEDHTDDLTTSETKAETSAADSTGTLDSADQNGAATAAPGSGHAYSIDGALIDAEGNAEQSAVYSATVTVTGVADGVIIGKDADLTLGTYTVTLGAA